MAQYIDKGPLVEKIKHHLRFTPEHTNAFNEGEEHAYKTILSFINSQETKEVDLEKEIELYWKQCDLTWCKDAYTMTHIRAMLSDIAKHFAKVGLQSQSEEKIVAEEEGTCNKILNRIACKNWNIIGPVYKMNVNNGEKVKIRIIKGE
jgi:hypothetical protein